MTPAEAVMLLAYAGNIDPRVRRSEDDDTELQARAWASILEDVHLDDGEAAVDAHYRRADPKAILPGDIRTYCVARANGRIERVAAAAIAGPDLVPMPEEVRQQIVRIRANWSAPLRMNTPSRDQGTPHRPDRRTETDADRKRAGRAVTVCFGRGCATDVPVPPGWNPADRNAPPLFCGQCRSAERREAS